MTYLVLLKFKVSLLQQSQSKISGRRYSYFTNNLSRSLPETVNEVSSGYYLNEE